MQRGISSHFCRNEVESALNRALGFHLVLLEENRPYQLVYPLVILQLAKLLEENESTRNFLKVMRG